MPGMASFPETPRLTLRHLTAGDAEELIRLHSDPEVMRWITNGQPSDPAELREKVLPRWLELYEKHNGWGFFAAIDKRSGQFAGWFHLHPREQGDVYELGYRLHTRFWKQGLATEGAGHLLAKLLMEGKPSPAKVAARTMVGNAASRRVLEKLGLDYAREYEEQRFPGEDKRAVWYERETPTIVHRRVWMCQFGMNPTMIRRLPSGWVVMFDYQTLPGYLVLLSDPVQRDINHAPAHYRAMFLKDMALVGDALLNAAGARLINYMLLGNTDFALHAHIVARYENEAAELRKTGAWVYYPTHRKEQVMFDAGRDGELMRRIGEELDRVCAEAGVRCEKC
jgi:RimJ/RimL family protein N-acetyltransferase